MSQVSVINCDTLTMHTTQFLSLIHNIYFFSLKSLLLVLVTLTRSEKHAVCLRPQVEREGFTAQGISVW